MNAAYICDAVRTPIGRYGGALSSIRADDLATLPIKALMERNPSVDWTTVDDVVFGCANQSGEDNRNVARMAALLSGVPESVSGCTVNRLCGSGMDAVGYAARAIAAGEADLMIAGGVESMSRAPYVMPKPTEAFSRQAEIYDTTLGWRFVNKRMQELYGTDSMAETAENLVAKFGISRDDQDKFAFWSQSKTAAAQANGLFDAELIPVCLPQRKGEPIIVKRDEHPRATTLEKLAELKPIVRRDGTVTAGNASGINDGSAALLIASEAAVKKFNLVPKARVLGVAAAGVPPRIMGIGPVPATRKILARFKMSLEQIELLEFNEAFASQALACTRQLGLADNDPRINPQGGAIALGHPLGMSGARLITTATWQLQRTKARYALCAMCIGVGQGIAAVIERL
ncbi:MAG: 3-oxoadipyl-CoA thiolase [Limisphaerales bacterium]